MAITLGIPTALRQFTDGKADITLEASTVGAVLEALTITYPDLQRHLFSAPGVLRSFVNVYVNDEDIRSASGLETALKAGDTVLLIPSIAGGRLG